MTYIFVGIHIITISYFILKQNLILFNMLDSKQFLRSIEREKISYFGNTFIPDNKLQRVVHDSKK